MTTIKNVAIIGASGNLGPAVVDAFLKNGNFTVTAIQREESKATFPDAVKVTKIDLTSQEALTSAFKGQDAVISVAGAGQLSDQKLYIDAAIAAGVKRFVPSEFGSDLSDPKIVELVPIFQGKVDVTDYLESKESSTFSWTAVANGPFFDWGLKVGFLGFNLQDKTARIWDDGNTKFSSSNLSLIGQALVNSLLPEYFEVTKNQTIYISSHTATQSKILAGLEKLTGEKFKVETVDGKKLLEESSAKVKSGNFQIPDIYSIIQSIAFSSGLGNLSDHSKKSWNTKLGLPEEEDLEASLKKVL
jgi:uncharacterized protein YbjT (DUF2867 family)